MAGETLITVVGNLTDDPELRFTPSGAAVANFTVASTPRNFNRQTNEWEDGEAMFLRCSIWRQAAENVAESLQRGMRVVVQGRLKARTYETREGEKRTVFEVEVEEIGPSLKFATAKVNRTSRQGGGGGYSGGGNGGGNSGGYSGGGNAGGGGGQSAPQDDPWASPAPASGGQGGGNRGGASNDPWGAPGVQDEPPF
ncbi:single-stranded DNA-binding protein [Nocardioides flavescens]|uniref:Single-stranded DNA-binding protein n=1 Tax=Nocardioides flavescens TaxID=2691959 RepID=A0A6L7EZT0_9ACTN|nr:single-stranded DNA-binding protein [Nocardioides flavescens]MXG91348.1 single-stranded DNA-binding protein [Nocardioides flavescens]